MVASVLVTLVMTVCMVPHTYADLYLHNPRGSNNRLNEKTATRKTNNRLFDSQNNNRGGYNVGDLTDVPAGTDKNNQYNMSGVYGSSHLHVEWTNQHGCGGNEDTDPQKQNCNLVLQYMCEDAHAEIPDKDQLRDGTSTARGQFTNPPANEKEAAYTSRRNKNLDVNRGLHESWDSYNACYLRENNAGLFLADQKLKKNNQGYTSAIHTRQDNNGNQNGYECPEERDYFPYWHPTQWKDIAILAENSSMCSHYQTKSFNVQAYHQCVETWPSGKRKLFSRWNNEQDCTVNNGKWTLLSNYLEKAPDFKTEARCRAASTGAIKYIWAVPYDSPNVNNPECLVALSAPECREAPWSRSNHLGNGRGTGESLSYKWTLPYFPSKLDHRCVFRMRYNISTDDYDPYHTNASQNGNPPVQDNPQVDVGGPSKLQLALNTDQTGRVFQDRSHVFVLRARPAGWERETIYNLNARGKRGNIVQVYPAVEYDFSPTNLHLKSTDLVHIQWTGSNTHNNNAPGGDGATGDDGQGKAGSDRLNIAQIGDLNQNLPLPYEQTTMWRGAEVMWMHHGEVNISPKDLALDLATVGYYRCFKAADCRTSELGQHAVDTKGKLQNLLDNAPASYEGTVLRFKPGTYHYMCTRNNNFTNRSNKGTIHVK